MGLRKLKAKKKKTSKNATVMIFDPFQEEQFISTSSLGFDVLLSEKGLGVEVGSMIEVASDSGLGKSTSMFAMACNQARNFGVKVVYLDAEGGIKRSHIRLNDAMDLFHPKTSELIEKYADNLGELLEYALEDNYNMIILQANSFSGLDNITKAILNYTDNHDEPLVFIIDSLAFLGTTSELEDSQSDKAWVSQKAKAIRAWTTLNKINLNAHGITTYMINHLTMQGIGQLGPQKPKADSSGGTAMRYSPDIRILIKQGEKIYDEIETPTGKIENEIGHIAKVSTKKNRNNVSNVEIAIPMIKGVGFDNALFIKEVLKEQGLVKFSAWTTFDFPFLEEPKKVQGAAGSLNFIREHEEEFTEYLKDQGLLSLLALGEQLESTEENDEYSDEDDD